MVKQNFQPEYTPVSPSDAFENLSTIIQFSEISTLNKLSFDPDALPIWELVAQISAEVPDEEWQKLPTDLARRFDYYQRSPSNHHHSTSELGNSTTEHQHPSKKLETSPSKLQVSPSEHQRCTFELETLTSKPETSPSKLEHRTSDVKVPSKKLGM
ncbi:hypothetical protein [Halotia branconii]|uniref:Uncharacterized protein n=1 Tax=Halotia branconii CENA392 TaxID=1539056 RepID=A0AAJ6P7W9_9CYAN|nr:hypothetical protein [Halotia branconii]WGV24179.1 hypothetical protein QI031_20560 [Halotia branconii CENA392]